MWLVAIETRHSWRDSFHRRTVEIVFHVRNEFPNTARFRLYSLLGGVSVNSRNTLILQARTERCG